MDYVVTSNHIHLLLYDIADRECIPRTIQLIAGRTGQEFNQRKRCKGAFWEDRYHATAVESREHLIQCILYIDLNMVRAGVVSHPLEWGRFSGYKEIQNPKERYSLIDHAQLVTLLGKEGIDDLIDSHAARVDDAVKQGNKPREVKWTESIAVGSKEFVEKIKEKLGALFLSRKVEGEEGRYELHDPQCPTGLQITPFHGGIFSENFQQLFLETRFLESKSEF